MSNVIIVMLVVVPILIGICVGGILLQIHLSRQDSRWLGLMPSMVLVALSLLVVFSMALFITTPNSGETEMTEVSYDEDGEVISSYTYKVEDDFVVVYAEPTVWSIILQMITVLVLFDWPVIILLIIHFTIRSNRSKNKEVDKMSIQDL